jgi:hypothetical protein
MGVRMDKSYVCFPCKKVAKKVKGAFKHRMGTVIVPNCPKCGNKMVHSPIASPIPCPSDEKAWERFEKRVSEEIEFVSEYNPRLYIPYRSAPCAPERVRIKQ